MEELMPADCDLFQTTDLTEGDVKSLFKKAKADLQGCVYHLWRVYQNDQYKKAGYNSFTEACESELGMTGKMVVRLVDHFNVIQEAQAAGIPTKDIKESHTRELVKIGDSKTRMEVLAESIETAPTRQVFIGPGKRVETNKVTAKHVAETRERMLHGEPEEDQEVVTGRREPEYTNTRDAGVIVLDGGTSGQRDEADEQRDLAYVDGKITVTQNVIFVPIIWQGHKSMVWVPFSELPVEWFHKLVGK